MAFLTVENGPDAGQRHEVKGPVCVLGRHPECHIVVEVGAVSRQHAQVVVEGSNFFVEDLKSRNGTYLNEALIEGRTLLREGDVVRVCDVSFAFHEDRPLGALSPPTSRNSLTSTIAGTGGRGTIWIDDEDHDGGSTIMSKLDVSSSHGRVQMTASPEVKLNALIEITRALGKALVLDEVLPGVLNSLFKIFVQADRGFIVMRAPDGNLVPLWTKVRRETNDDTIRISRTIVRQVMDSKEAILSADAASDERFEMSQSIADFRIRSMMCAPLLDTEGKSMGVMQIDTLDQRKRFQKEDLEVLASVAVQAGIAIDNAQLHEQALKQKAIERDLEVAHEVQRGFLPRTAPEIAGYEFFNYYQAANHVGGDYFDYIQLADGRVAVIVADVVGHGIAAALMMAKLAAEAKFWLASEEHVDRAFSKLNDAMSNMQLDRFVTMIVCVLEPETNQVTIVNAGHMAPIRRAADGSLTEPGEDIGGLPLGITDGLEYAQQVITLAPQETLTLYTDGINECASGDGKMYGIDRIRELLQPAGKKKASELGQTIIDDVRHFLRTGTQIDDMCLVCFGRTA